MSSAGEWQGAPGCDWRALLFWSCLVWMDAPAPGARVEGQRCGCTAGRVRLIFNFSLPLLAIHNLDLEEGLGPLVGLGFFSVSSAFQGC